MMFVTWYMPVQMFILIWVASAERCVTASNLLTCLLPAVTAFQRACLCLWVIQSIRNFCCLFISKAYLAWTAFDFDLILNLFFFFFFYLYICLIWIENTHISSSLYIFGAVCMFPFVCTRGVCVWLGLLRLLVHTYFNGWSMGEQQSVDISLGFLCHWMLFPWGWTESSISLTELTKTGASGEKLDCNGSSFSHRVHASGETQQGCQGSTPHFSLLHSSPNLMHSPPPLQTLWSP